MACTIERRSLSHSRDLQNRPPRASDTLRRFLRGLWRWGLSALFAVVFSSNATAQTLGADDPVDAPGLVIEAVLGWDGTISQSMPIPVSFLISNYSDRLIEGQLTLSDPMSGHEVTLGELVVSPGGTRRFASIQDLSDWFQCVATLHDGDRVLWRRELPLQTGNEFISSINFALFLDDSGRSLQLPGVDADVSVMSAAEAPASVSQGGLIRSLTVKSWQVPDHPGPLVVAKAVIFPDGATPELNRLQWRAIAEWMCQGGIVFVHKESRETIERLLGSAPLDREPPVQSGAFQRQRVGLGAIYEYPQPLFASEGKEARKQMAQMIAQFAGNPIRAMVDSGRLHRHGAGRADVNRILVVAFFIGYALFSGFGALLLYRLSRRWIIIYTVSIVVGASVLSGLLGGFLRFSQGDLRWMTVTQAGAGGLVQYGRLDVQSAGGRNTHVAITGERPDLQLLARRPRYHWMNRGPTDYAPFTWQPNLAADDGEVYQIRVPMTPWGERQLSARAFQRGVPRLEFQLDFEPHERPVGPDGVPAGDFSLKVANHLPFDIKDAWLFIRFTGEPRSASPSEDQPTSNSAQQFGMPPDAVLPEWYQIHHVRDLEVGAIVEEQFEASLQNPNRSWELTRAWDQGTIVLPGTARFGTAGVWIIARIDRSPILAVDENRSDFVPQDEFHVFIQEILPEDMSDAALLLLGADDALAP